MKTIKKIKPFSVKARGKSIGYAFEGIIKFFKSEHNALLHLLATISVCSLAVVMKASKAEILSLVIAVGFVWTAELFNTAIERIMDFMTEEKHPQIKFIKDLSAAAVLVSAIVALVTGAIVFIPKL